MEEFNFRSQQINQHLTQSEENQLSSFLLQNPHPPTQQKPWHGKITTEMRKSLIKKIIQTIFPTSDESTYRDARMNNLIQYAYRTEYEIYEQAKDQEDYFHLLAERIYKIQKELEEKRNVKNRTMGTNYAPLSKTIRPNELASSIGALAICSNCKLQNKFEPEELREKLMSSFDKMNSQEPESLPFREPVDPVVLQLPDYFDVVKKPMDLSTIKSKLDEGKYSNPQEYVNDVWLMFNNAWLYNKKTSKVYKYCTKLSEIFSSCIDPVMQSMACCRCAQIDLALGAFNDYETQPFNTNIQTTLIENNPVKKQSEHDTVDSQSQFSSAVNNSVQQTIHRGLKSGDNTDFPLLQDPYRPTQLKSWHEKITTETRKSSIRKIIQSIYPTNDENIYHDARLSYLIKFAYRTEFQIYEQANEQEEYFDLLAERICKLREEFEKK